MAATFARVRAERLFETDPALAAKLNKIFAKYVCFKEEPLAALRAAPLHGRHGGHWHANSRGNRPDRRVQHQQHSHAATPAPTGAARRHISAQDKLKRDIVGLTNKANGSNREVIWAKLRGCITAENAGDVADAILACCARQNAYAKVYLSLLDNIFKIHAVPVCDRVRAYIQSFYDNAADLACLSDMGRERNVTAEYDEFCAAVKAKAALLARCNITISLVHQFGEHAYDGGQEAAEADLVSFGIRLIDLASSMASETQCSGALDIVVELLLILAIQGAYRMPACVVVATRLEGEAKGLKERVSSKMRFRLVDFQEKRTGTGAGTGAGTGTGTGTVISAPTVKRWWDSLKGQGKKHTAAAVPSDVCPEAPPEAPPDSPPWRSVVGRQRPQQHQQYRRHRGGRNRKQ